MCSLLSSGVTLARIEVRFPNIGKYCSTGKGNHSIMTKIYKIMTYFWAIHNDEKNSTSIPAKTCSKVSLYCDPD